MAVTREQILAAADQIAATGERPTLEAVRQIVGGSYTTISPVLNEWKARQEMAARPLREPAPQAVGDRLAEVGADIWAIALGLANSRLASEREALEKARADMETAQAEAAELADKLTGKIEALQARLASTEARADEIERRAAELRTELDRSHQEADQARQEAVKAREEAARLTGQLAAVQEQTASILSRLVPAKTKPAAKKSDKGTPAA